MGWISNVVVLGGRRKKAIAVVKFKNVVALGSRHTTAV
jgi:hypothetical protein